MSESSERNFQDFQIKFEKLVNYFSKAIICLFLVKNKDSWYIIFGRIDFSDLPLNPNSIKYWDYHGEMLFINIDNDPQSARNIIDAIYHNKPFEIDKKSPVCNCTQLMTGKAWSGSENRGIKIDWPRTDYYLLLKAPPFNKYQRHLSSPNAPFFSNVDDAMREFFSLKDIGYGTDPIINVILPDYRVRIKSLHIGEKDVSFQLEKHLPSYNDVYLKWWYKINGITYHPIENYPIKENGEVEIEIAGVPEDLGAVIKSGNDDEIDCVQIYSMQNSKSERIIIEPASGINDSKLNQNQMFDVQKDLISIFKEYVTNYDILPREERENIAVQILEKGNELPVILRIFLEKRMPVNQPDCTLFINLIMKHYPKKVEIIEALTKNILMVGYKPWIVRIHDELMVDGTELVEITSLLIEINKRYKNELQPISALINLIRKCPEKQKIDWGHLIRVVCERSKDLDPQEINGLFEEITRQLRDFKIILPQVLQEQFKNLQQQSLEVKKLFESPEELEKALVNVKKESELREKIIIPLLHKLKFEDIEDTHGANEFGIDIICSNKNPFEIKEWNAFIIKLGPIKLQEASETTNLIENIYNQIRDAKKMKHSDKNIGEINTTRIFVLTNDEINWHAQNKLHSLAKEIKGNVFFVDKNKLLQLFS